MAPKKKADEAPQEEEPVEPAEPVEPEIVKRCCRTGATLFYGDTKARPGDGKGFVRHGFGIQVESAVAKAGYKKSTSDSTVYETVVVGNYEGHWADDVMTGEGIYQWSDGSSYDGSLLDGRMHGQGKLQWPDGSVYEGAWLSGMMTGHGKLSLSSGKVLEGRFHNNGFQKEDGSWVDVLREQRTEEQQLMLGGDIAGLQTRRVAVGEVFSGTPDAVHEQKAQVLRALEEIQRSGFVPFLLAEDNVAGSALECATTLSITDCATQCASVRVAAVKKRRLHDHHRNFYNAIQASLRDGTFFGLVFEDDDEGCDMLEQEQEDWYSRKFPADVPTRLIPEDWQLGKLLHGVALPPEVFQPALFNSRGLASHYLGEAAKSLLGQLPHPSSEPGAAKEGAEARPDAEAEAASAAAAKEVAGAAAAPEAAAKKGLTGHFFEPKNVPLQVAGLSVTYCLRPAVIAMARVPTGLSDEELCSQVVHRFSKHVPLHRTVLVLLCNTVAVPAPKEPLAEDRDNMLT